MEEAEVKGLCGLLVRGWCSLLPLHSTPSLSLDF